MNKEITISCIKTVLSEKEGVELSDGAAIKIADILDSFAIQIARNAREAFERATAKAGRDFEDAIKVAI